MSAFDAYLENVAPWQKAEFERLRAIVHATVPDVEEAISYGIPTYRYNGKYILYIGCFKHHMSAFPGAAMTESLKSELDGYKFAKGTVQFTEAKPLPDAIIKRILHDRLAQVA